MIPTNGSTKEARILLVDDHAIVRDGVRFALERHAGWKICGEASNGRAGVAAASELKPDIVILDVTLPELSGVEALKQIKHAEPSTEVIIFTAHQMEDLVHAVFAAGARSYLLKTDDSTHLIQAVEAALDRKPYFTPRISEIVFSRYIHSDAAGERPEPGESLTAREREVVKMVAEGRSNKEVASHLGVGVRTAESHRAALMKKLGVKSLGELIRYALRNKLIEE